MTDDYQDRLIQGFLDDSLTPGEQTELESAILRSEAVRKRFWELAEVHGLLKQATDVAWPAGGVHSAVSTTEPRERMRSSHSRRRRLAGLRLMNRSALMLVVGVAIGVLAASMAWAIASVPSHARFDLLDESFEDSPDPKAIGLSTERNRWCGDLSQVVGAEQGVRPVHGQSMLKYLRADYPGKQNASESYCSDLYRLIDLRPYREQLEAGMTVAELSAAFNAGAYPEDEWYVCGLGMYAISSEMAANTSSLLAMLNSNESLAMTRMTCPRLDRDPATWQKVACSLEIPADADVLLLHLSISHTHNRNYTKRHIDFGEHYIDDIRMGLTRPAQRSL